MKKIIFLLTVAVGISSCLFDSLCAMQTDIVRDYEYYASCGTNFSMTKRQMKKKITKRFRRLQQKGIMISEEEFEKIKERYFLSSSNVCKFIDHCAVSRVWGVEFLKSKIHKFADYLGQFDVPSYVIVLEDPENIKVEIRDLGYGFPVVARLKNARVYFEKISGDSCACFPKEGVGNSAGKLRDRDKVFKKLSEITCFADFYDPGNIIQEQFSHKYYIVDTEYNSFGFHRSSKHLKSSFQLSIDLLGEEEQEESVFVKFMDFICKC